MKIKGWVLWLLVAAFLASEVFLFSAKRDQDAALVKLAESEQQVAELQTELDQLKNASDTAQGSEIARLRAANLDLPRLRNQVTQLQDAAQKLQAANQKLTQQLNATLTAAQQQQAQLQQLAVENQQTRAVAQQLSAEAARNTCLNRLRQIDGAKQQWALENNKPGSAIPTAQDIAPYIKLDADGNIPGCPAGGTYSINAVSEIPTCSLPGHVLP